MLNSQKLTIRSFVGSGAVEHASRDWNGGPYRRKPGRNGQARNGVCRRGNGNIRAAIVAETDAEKRALATEPDAEHRRERLRN